MGATVIIGYGYVGGRLAEAAKARGENVSALARSDAAAQRAAAAGISALRADLDEPSSLTALDLRGSSVVYLAPPPTTGTTDSRVRNLAAALPQDRAPHTFVYISTTAVYGDCGGAWIDESTPPRPTQDRGARRLDAETTLMEWGTRVGCRVVILRVGGIYGPLRIPLERLRKGEPMVDDPTHPSFVNVIHADDLVRVCLAAADRGQHGAIFNVCDGHPLTMMHYFSILAELAGLPAPRAITMADAKTKLSPGMLSYVQDSRRIDNKKLRNELGVELRFANARIGLRDCLRYERPLTS